MNGKNIADFVDRDVITHLQNLELQEDQEMAALQAQGLQDDESDEDPQTAALADAIRKAKRKIVAKKRNGVLTGGLPRSARRLDRDAVEEKFVEMGMEEDKAEGVMERRSAAKRGRSLVSRGDPLLDPDTGK
ncbi:unnamed protein product, partial [Symbiodinium sp. KB8]